MSPPVHLVDDDEAVRKALALLPRTVGMEVHTFAFPEMFLTRLDGLEPGCLIFDIRMPVISGLKVQERLTARGVT